jgi:plasmid stabilization system protein ParE
MQIVAALQQLAAFPMSGKAGRVLGTRELVISHTPFIAAYAIDRADIIILAIYHGRTAVAGEPLTGEMA